LNSRVVVDNDFKKVIKENKKTKDCNGKVEID
jgi:hypothetical protein